MAHAGQDHGRRKKDALLQILRGGMADADGGVCLLQRLAALLHPVGQFRQGAADRRRERFGGYQQVLVRGRGGELPIQCLDGIGEAIWNRARRFESHLHAAERPVEVGDGQADLAQHLLVDQVTGGGGLHGATERVEEVPEAPLAVAERLPEIPDLRGARVVAGGDLAVGGGQCGARPRGRLAIRAWHGR